MILRIKSLALMGLLLTVLSITTHAQKVDSVWFDKKWKQTTLPQEQYYLRTVKLTNGVFDVTDHHHNGKVQMTGHFSSMNPEIRNGEFSYYSTTGVLTQKNIWVNNLLAETLSYDSTGKKTMHVIKQEYLATLSPEEKFKKHGIKEIDKHPEFPKGDKVLADYLTKNLVYPAKAAQDKIHGTVILAATIDENGNLLKIKLLKSAHPLLDAEAIRVAELLPKKKWKPAQDKGKNITADFNFPVAFNL